MTSTELLFCWDEELGFGLCLDFMNSARIYWACWKAIRITPSRDKLSKKNNKHWCLQFSGMFNESYKACNKMHFSNILLVILKKTADRKTQNK